MTNPSPAASVAKLKRSARLAQISPSGEWALEDEKGVVIVTIVSDTFPKLDPEMREWVLGIRKKGGKWRPRTFDEIIEEKEKFRVEAQQAAYNFAIEISKLEYRKAQAEETS